MICIRRRYGLSAAPLSAVMSSPSKRIVPAVGSMRRRSRRPTVVLPQPDSPTRPSVSPRRISKLTPSTAWTMADRPLQDAAADREVLDEVAHLDQRRPAAGRRGPSARVRLPARHGDPSTAPAAAPAPAGVGAAAARRRRRGRASSGRRGPGRSGRSSGWTSRRDARRPPRPGPRSAARTGSPPAGRSGWARCPG